MRQATIPTLSYSGNRHHAAHSSHWFTSHQCQAISQQALKRATGNTEPAVVEGPLPAKMV